MRDCTLLIIDDSPEDRETYRRLLRHAATLFEIHEAETGHEGLAAARSLRPDCILLDHDLPDTDGLELFRELRGESASSVAVVMITGHGDEALAVRAMKHGVEDYIAKQDVTAPVLQLAVRNAIEKVTLRREVEQQRSELERLYVVEQLRRADLERSVRERDAFLATLAHELRNPLSPISHAVELLQMADDDASLRRELRDVLGRQVRQMTRLIDDLLDVSRISRGRIELRREHIDLHRIVSAAVESVRPSIAESRHQLDVMESNEPLMVNVDPVRLAQVVTNLLNNAVKYTPNGGRIQIETSRENGQALLRVRDNGIGIPADRIAGIFEMFAQVETSLEHSRGGLGIGLTLVKNLVEMHGGSVSATSEGTGKGSQFEVRLPSVSEGSRHAAA